MNLRSIELDILISKNETRQTLTNKLPANVFVNELDREGSFVGRKEEAVAEIMCHETLTLALVQQVMEILS